MKISAPHASRDHARKGDESGAAHLSKWSLCTYPSQIGLVCRVRDAYRRQHETVPEFLQHALHATALGRWLRQTASRWSRKLTALEMCLYEMYRLVTQFDIYQKEGSNDRTRRASVCGRLPSKAHQPQFFSVLMDPAQAQLASS